MFGFAVGSFFTFLCSLVSRCCWGKERDTIVRYGVCSEKKERSDLTHLKVYGASETQFL